MSPVLDGSTRTYSPKDGPTHLLSVSVSILAAMNDSTACLEAIPLLTFKTVFKVFLVFKLEFFFQVQIVTNALVIIDRHCNAIYNNDKLTCYQLITMK